jgi:hypothetical protein
VVEPTAALLAILLVGAQEEPARKLPPVTTVCRAADGGRCWTERGESVCTGGDVFRIVIDEPGRSDVAQALADCRRPPDTPRSQ